MALPTRVKLVKVGPRDGLQNEKQPVPAAVKDRAGPPPASRRPDARSKSPASSVAQVGAADGRQRRGDGRHSAPGRCALFGARRPTCKGFEAAARPQPDEIVVFGAASEAFSQKNINCSIAESIERFRAGGGKPRGRPASRCAAPCRAPVGCPYEGEVAPSGWSAWRS